MKKIQRTWKVCSKSSLKDIKERIIHGILDFEVFDIPKDCKFLSNTIIHDESKFNDWYGFVITFEAPDSYLCHSNEGLVEEIEL